MGALWAKIQSFFSTAEISVCLVGLERSGKTTLLNVLCNGNPMETLPTIGLNVKQIKKDNVNIKMWDLGGQQQYRNRWSEYARDADVIMYIVDCADISRIEESRDALHYLLGQLKSPEMPVIVIGNKIDLEPSLSKEELVERMDLEKLMQTDVVVVRISALKVVHINDVVDWLIKHSKSNINQ